MTLTQEELTELLRRRRDLSGKDWPEICAAFYWRECLDYLDRLRKADYVFAFKPRDPEGRANLDRDAIRDELNFICERARARKVD